MLTGDFPFTAQSLLPQACVTAQIQKLSKPFYLGILTPDPPLQSNLIESSVPLAATLSHTNHA
jgi:hypothetical protein